MAKSKMCTALKDKLGIEFVHRGGIYASNVVRRDDPSTIVSKLSHVGVCTEPKRQMRGGWRVFLTDEEAELIVDSLKAPSRAPAKW